MKIHIIILITIVTVSCMYGKNKLENLYHFDEGEVWGLIIDNKNDSLLIQRFIREREETYHASGLYITNSVIFENDNNRYDTISPNGNYITKYSNENLVILNTSNYQINTILTSNFDYYKWTYDSKSIYYYAEEGKQEIPYDNLYHELYRFDIGTGKNEQIFKTKVYYFYPVTVQNPDVIYLLKNNNLLDGPEESEIYRYSISQKKFEKVKLPVDMNVFMDYFTISPDERTVICQDTNFLLYFMDLQNQKVMETITNKVSVASYFFNWKPDSSYVLFGMTRKDVYRYSIEK